MADKTKLIRLVQLKLRNTDTDFKKHIIDVIEAAWAYLAKMADWWFLEEGTALPITMVANTRDYVVDQENIGQILYIANSGGRKLWEYKSRRNFLKYQNSGPGSRYTQDSDQTGQVAVFTTAGVKGKKTVLRLWPAPNDAFVSNNGTVYLHWKEGGTLANLNKLPIAWTKVILHLVGSMIEEPKNLPHNMFKAMTEKEEGLFRLSLDDMMQHEAPADNDVHEFDYDSKMQSELDDINLT